MRSNRELRRTQHEHKRAPKWGLPGSCFKIRSFGLNQLRASPPGYVTSSRRCDKYTKFSPLRPDGIPSEGCRVPINSTRLYPTLTTLLDSNDSQLFTSITAPSITTSSLHLHPRPVNRNLRSTGKSHAGVGRETTVNGNRDPSDECCLIRKQEASDAVKVAWQTELQHRRLGDHLFAARSQILAVLPQ